MFLTTSLFNRLAQESGGEIFRGVEHLMVGGEAHTLDFFPRRKRRTLRWPIAVQQSLWSTLLRRQ